MSFARVADSGVWTVRLPVSDTTATIALTCLRFDSVTELNSSQVRFETKVE
jgi:hypothetical protein